MKINCRLKTYVKGKKENKSRFWAVHNYDAHIYEEKPKEFDVQYKLQIVSVNDNIETLDVLKEREVFKDGKQYMIDFHTQNYMYDSARDVIYNLTLIQDI